MTADVGVGMDAAHDGVIEAVATNKTRTVRHCKNKIGPVSAGHLIYIQLGPEKAIDTIHVVLGGKLVANEIPCIVYWPNTRAKAASLQERQPLLATWQKTEIAVFSIGETDMVPKAS